MLEHHDVKIEAVAGHFHELVKRRKCVSLLLVEPLQILSDARLEVALGQLPADELVWHIGTDGQAFLHGRLDLGAHVGRQVRGVD